jgi:hypothetical protein
LSPPLSPRRGGEALPETPVKEALEQLLKFSELPLAAPVKSGGVPEAVAEKAAGIIIRAAGLTPDAATLEAAKALMRHNVQVDRNSVQSLVSVASGKEGEARLALLNAAARLLAHDIPLARPLASGMADILSRGAGWHELAEKAAQTLADIPERPEIGPLVRSAREILALLHVDLDRSDAPQALERYVSTFGREALGKALALVEKSVQAVLESHPLLPKIDQALGQLLTQAAGRREETETSSPRPDGNRRESVPVSAAKPAFAPPEAGTLFPTPGGNRPEVELLGPAGSFTDLFGLDGELPDKRGGTPSPAAKEAEKLIADLLSEQPEKAEKAWRGLPGRGPEVIREAVRQLSRLENRALRSEPLLNLLAEAAGAIRDLGRQILAAKAENLAGRERDPGVMLAEVPFTLSDSQGDGRMQMFYRRSQGKAGGWTSRVILDLNTTGLGPVLGDLRFFGKDLILNLFVDRGDTARYLEAAADDLLQALRDKGFRPRPRFLVLPPPKPPEIRSENPLAAAPPTPAETVAPLRPVGPRRRGGLDVKG